MAGVGVNACKGLKTGSGIQEVLKKDSLLHSTLPADTGVTSTIPLMIVYSVSICSTYMTQLMLGTTIILTL